MYFTTTKFEFFIFSLLFSLIFALDPPFGQLKITGKHVTKLDGTPIQLRGMSLAWSINTTTWAENWFTPYWQSVTVALVKCSWNANVIRAPMAADFGGFLQNPETEYQKVKTIIEAAIDMGIYVIVDWHDEHANYANHTPAAIQFFSVISQTYGKYYPHIIYETFNEPVNATWDELRVYHAQVVQAIRTNDPNNIIVVGTPNWSTDVDIAADNPLNGTNIAYTLHIYAASHYQPFRNKTIYALNKGLPIFVTEYGVCESSGNGTINESMSRDWWDFWDQNMISYVNWGMYDKNEAAAALLPNTQPAQVGDSSRWSTGGNFVNQMLWAKNPAVGCAPGYNFSNTASKNLVDIKKLSLSTSLFFVFILYF